MIVAQLPEEFWISVNTVQLFALVYLAIAISRLREKIAKMEEWIRQQERRNGLANSEEGQRGSRR